MHEHLNPGDGATFMAREKRHRAQVRWWLYLVVVTLFALFVVGGATRLTESGLSITEWKPIHGVIPPLSEAEWQEELEKYRQIPEYQLINKGMVWSPSHGDTAFTVPLFDEFMKRIMPGDDWRV